MSESPRALIGRSIEGDVLEVGPGSNPFPTAPGARTRFADRPVEGGRDANWPELVGAPWGPQADLAVDLDLTGLEAVASESLDVVIACHVIEHLANPLRALTEFERVLRPGGRLVLVVPDRSRTFDSVRRPTTFDHLLREYRGAVTEVDEPHIREFCAAMFMQRDIHPPAVREWHDPRRLDAQRLALHRRRSIHVHCWSPEEFAAHLAAAQAEDLMAWQLESLYFVEDLPKPDSGYEFGLVLRKARTAETAPGRAQQFIDHWVHLALTTSRCDASRVALFARALQRDTGAARCLPGAAQAATAALQRLGVRPKLPKLDTHVLPRLRHQLRLRLDQLSGRA